MPLEQELKFSLIDDIPRPDELQTIFKQAGLEIVSQGTQKHFDVYFDDPKESLRKAGIALRKRRSANKMVATLKTNATVSGELHKREETELEMLGNTWPDVFEKLQTRLM
jgi:inorganic triphosphatase YgiF